MRMRRPTSILMAIAMVIGVAGPVSGANPATDGAGLTEVIARASDQYAAFNALSAREQQAVLDYTSLAYVTTQVSPVTQVSRPTSAVPGPTSALVSAAAVKCWTWTWGRAGRNVAGITVWEFTQRIDWCGDGAKITNVPFRRVIGAPKLLWWSYEGLVGDTTGGGKGFATYRSFVQGKFIYRPPISQLNQDNFPWLDMTARANGAGTGSGGG